MNNPTTATTTTTTTTTASGGTSASRSNIKKYKSGSTSAINMVSKASNQARAQHHHHNTANLEINTQQQPQHEITYSLDSDESLIVDNLINNPTQLKEKLKQGKMDREQLNQLQENYLRLLEQYAEAENFIDTVRLGTATSAGSATSAGGVGGAGSAQTKSNSNLNANTPSMNMFQVMRQTNKKADYFFLHAHLSLLFKY